MTTTPTKPRNGLLASRFWRQIKRYVHVEVYDRDGGHKRPRVRFEVIASNAMLSVLTSIRVPCVTCGRPIYPVRARAENDDDRNPASRPPPRGHYYLAVTCPLTTKIGCSRSGAARDEYDEIKLVLRPDLAALAQSRVPTTTGRPPMQRRPKPMKKPTKKNAAKKPTARDKALAKIADAKNALKAARASAASAARDASAKRKAAKKAATEQERAEGLVFQRANQLVRASEALNKIDAKLEAAKDAKAAAKAGKHVHAAPTEGAPTLSDDEDEDTVEVEEEAETEAGATDDDDMGDDDADETPTADDDMGDDEEDTDEGKDLREDSV